MARAVGHDAILRAILADVRRLERQRDTELRRRVRDVGKLATAWKSAKARQARHRLRDAQLECRDVDRLRRDIEGLLDLARAQLAALEVEVTAGMNAAMVRYLAANATRGDTTKLDVARTSLPFTFATELAKARHATAIAIADRDKMREMLRLMSTDPERAVEADEWRRELVVHEATVAHLEKGFRWLVAHGPSR